MRNSASRSRSRSKGNRRGGSRRSPQERGGYQKSRSRSDSRGRDSKRNDPKRRNKFSDPSQNGGGNQRGGFSSGFTETGDNFRGQGGNNGNQFQQKGGQPQFGSQPRMNENHYNNNDQNGNNGGFSYTNVRNHHANNQDTHLDIEKAIQIQKQDSAYNRTIIDRATGNNNFQANFTAAGSYDNYQASSQSASSSLRQGGGSKISRKVYIPQDGKFNYIGLIIGPKGSKQKQLEEMTSCKILIRGKGSQKQNQPQQPDDNEELHVLIEADNEMNATKAMREIENIIFMDDDQKVKMRDSQLKSTSSYPPSGNIGGLQGRQEGYHSNNDRQTFIQVPNNCVGLVIGRKGETIKQIKEKSGADKVFMQPENQRNTDDSYQNLIVEGSQDAVEKVRELIADIQNQQKKKSGGGSDAKIEMEIPANLAGLIIGKQGSTLQQVGAETKTRCQIQQNNPDDRKILIIIGQTQEDCQRAKEIFEDKMNNRQGGSQLGGNNGRFERGGDNNNNQRGGYNNNNRGGGSFNGNRGGGGARPNFNNRRPRKNADDDEIVENANQYDYYPTYNLHEQMMQSQQMLVNMQNQLQYQQPYQQQQQQYPNQDGQQAQYPAQQQQDPHGGADKQPEQQHAIAPQQVENNMPSEQVALANGQGQVSQQGGDYAGYQQGAGYHDQAQMQMQLQQYLQYQQMYIQTQSYSGPVIEEVLADGTVVSVNQNEEDKKKGKRGGRR